MSNEKRQTKKKSLSYKGGLQQQKRRKKKQNEFIGERGHIEDAWLKEVSRDGKKAKNEKELTNGKPEEDSSLMETKIRGTLFGGKNCKNPMNYESQEAGSSWTNERKEERAKRREGG